MQKNSRHTSYLRWISLRLCFLLQFSSVFPPDEVKIVNIFYLMCNKIETIKKFFRFVFFVCFPSPSAVDSPLVMGGWLRLEGNWCLREVWIKMLENSLNYFSFVFSYLFISFFVAFYFRLWQLYCWVVSLWNSTVLWVTQKKTHKYQSYLFLYLVNSIFVRKNVAEAGIWMAFVI